jgi:hypothetical protein
MSIITTVGAVIAAKTINSYVNPDYPLEESIVAEVFNAVNAHNGLTFPLFLSGDIITEMATRIGVENKVSICDGTGEYGFTVSVVLFDKEPIAVVSMAGENNEGSDVHIVRDPFPMLAFMLSCLMKTPFRMSSVDAPFHLESIDGCQATLA